MPDTTEIRTSQDSRQSSKSLLLEKLEQHVQRNTGNRLQRTLRAPLLLPTSKALEKFCRLTGSTYNLQARLFWGERMNVVFPEIVSCFLYRYGFFEPDLTKIVIHSVNPGDVVFDIGTHFGYYSLLASHLVGRQGQVHSFEPTQHTHEVVRSNLGAKGNVKLNNAAAWSETTQLKFKDYGKTMSAFNSLYEAKLEDVVAQKLQPTEYTVSAISIDEYVEAAQLKPSFIKIDAENAEHDILLGMKRTLDNIRPLVTLEVGDVKAGNYKDSASAVRLLIQHGYRAKEWQDDRLCDHSPTDSYLHANLLFVPE
ncbi:FkbM family methyltransferase [Hydrogenophaga sp.]|uniref:FkbM family methyltransferase n=1 Tax=Hydrogenophaga sp. TaxID=1904254 RepID=UPI003F72AA9D